MSVTLTLPRPASDGALGEAFDGASALAASIAAILALASLRQVSRLAAAERARSVRLATLETMRSQARSVGVQSKPPEIAVRRRARDVADDISYHTGASQAEARHLEQCLINCRLLDIPARLRAPFLRTINDWNDGYTAIEHEQFTALFNSLEEVSVSMNRGTIDFASLRKMHGTVILLSYREFAQWIYLQRRRGSYHYFDQLESLIGRLTKLEVAGYRRPKLADAFRFKSWRTKRRALARMLSNAPGPSLLDSNQLEAAILETGLVDEEESIRATLATPAWAHLFRKPPRGGFFARRAPTYPAGTVYTVESQDGSGATRMMHAILDVDLSVPAPVAAEGVTFSVDQILAQIPAGLFHPAHLHRRGAEGDFDGPPSLLVVLQQSGQRPRTLGLRSLVRALKLHLNDGQLRPFLLILTDAEASIQNAQELIHSEGGLLLRAQPSRSGVTALWLF